MKRKASIHYRQNPPIPWIVVVVVSNPTSSSPEPPMTTTSPGPPGEDAVVVVGEKYCSSTPISLTINKKTNNNELIFLIMDENGDVVFDVKEKVVNLRRRLVVRDAGGDPLLSIQRKLISVHGRCKIMKGDSSSSSSSSSSSYNRQSIVFTTKKTSLISLNTELDVFMASNTKQEHCDFKIKGCYFNRSCCVYRGESDSTVAKMSRKYSCTNLLLGKDTYLINISPLIDCAFVVALVAIVDEINERRNGSEGVHVKIRSSQC